ncbi:MAG: hypothetical protein IJ545_04195 [Alphaproteobacteria bacterium]|nr:hypothetical protein [Alphaproteobacteria bacterium]
MFGYIFLVVLGLGIIGALIEFLKPIAKGLIEILLIIGGVCLWIFGAPQAALILGMNKILVYILFGIFDFFICVGIYATLKEG